MIVVFSEDQISATTEIDAEIVHRAITQFYEAKTIELPEEFYLVQRNRRTNTFAANYTAQRLKMSREMGQERTDERQREFMR